MKVGKIQITLTSTNTRRDSLFSKSIYPYIVEATQHIVDLGFFEKLRSHGSSPPRRRGSSPSTKSRNWIPAFAGMTELEKSCNSVKGVPTTNISVVLGTDRDIIRLKKMFWGKQETSDVVSFCYPENIGLLPTNDKESEPAFEILINLKQAKRQKPGRWNLGKETVFLYIHGLLHCLGWDDRTKRQRKIMLDLGKRILNQAWT